MVFGLLVNYSQLEENEKNKTFQVRALKTSSSGLYTPLQEFQLCLFLSQTALTINDILAT